MLVTGLVSLLKNTSNVTAIVGNSIMSIPAPEDLDRYPLITFQVVSDVSSYTLTGPDGVTASRIVFNCYAKQDQYLVARTLALAVKAALTGYSGTLPDGTQVFQTQIVNIQDGFDDGSRLSKTSVHAMVTYSD